MYCLTSAFLSVLVIFAKNAASAPEPIAPETALSMIYTVSELECVVSVYPSRNIYTHC